MRPLQFQTETIFLFFLDGLANAIDFLFHFWMGRVLIPSDFAVLQTLNSLALVYVTSSGVFQPVVSRFVADARGEGKTDSIPEIFQSFLRAAFWLGLALSMLIFLFSNFIAELFNLPAWTIQISSALIFLSTLRPIAAGVLQGQERFIEFGFARLALSTGRIVIVFFLIQAGLGLSGAVIALPFGWLASVICAFWFLGSSLWKKESRAAGSLLMEGWKLSAYALVAYPPQETPCKRMLPTVSARACLIFAYLVMNPTHYSSLEANIFLRDIESRFRKEHAKITVEPRTGGILIPGL